MGTPGIYGICHLSMIPVRKEPSDKSEMTTQLLFGEHFRILAMDKQWRKISNAFDGYEGWIDAKQFEPVSDLMFQQLESMPLNISLDLVQVVVNKNLIVPVVLGSNLPFLENESLMIAETCYGFQGHARKTDSMLPKHMIVENAFMYLNAPYLWGGRSPFGIDCSGFTQMVYKLNGISLRRDAWQQAEGGITMNFLEEAAPGDLVFFDNDEGKITHTGILLTESKIIHASGKVRVDKIDHYGIFNGDMQKYTHKTRLIKRYL